ncbi:hypothetical protein, partial [Bifidobacterium pullorum]|uniref:hypothetical protein n=1 Tax=Bifidobacterium pullorum TaxID=78448 RepID=UPI003AF5F212
TETDPATGQTAFAQDFGHNLMIATITSIIVFLYQSVARTKSITSLHPHHLLDDGAPLSLILTLSIRHEAHPHRSRIEYHEHVYA